MRVEGYDFVALELVLARLRAKNLPRQIGGLARDDLHYLCCGFLLGADALVTRERRRPVELRAVTAALYVFVGREIEAGRVLWEV